MITILGIMDKLYSDTKSLTIIYFVGTGLLLLFIIMLAFSLRKDKDKKKETSQELEENIPDKDVSLFENDEKNDLSLISNEEELNEESKIVNENKKEEENKEEIGFNNEEIEKTEEPTSESLIESTQKLNITPMFTEDQTNHLEDEKVDDEVVDNEKNFELKKQEEDEKEDLKDQESIKINTEIPDVDSFVDQVVNKTIEKNEQFSSIYVGDETSTMKLDNVLDNLNVDKNIKNEIIPDSSTNEKVILNNEYKEEIVKPSISSLDELKKTLDEKKEKIESKEEELKDKLNSLKKQVEVPKIKEDNE